MLRLISINARGGSNVALVEHMARQEASVLVLNEYLHCSSTEPTLQALTAAGWVFQYSSTTGSDKRGVLVASRMPLTVGSDLKASIAAPLNHAVLELHLVEADIWLIGVYLPHTDGPEKLALWRALNQYVRKYSHRRVLMAGDFNSCTFDDTQGPKEYSPDQLAAMREVLVDAWDVAGVKPDNDPTDRYTFVVSNQYGLSSRRLDYAFLSPALQPLLSAARHDHAVRLQGLSDHSALYVDLTF